MRILLSTDVVGGVWSYTTLLARQLTARGHSCLIAVIGEPDAARLASVPHGIEVRSRALRLEWEPGGVGDAPRAARWLAEVAEEWHADVVHLGQLSYAIGDFSAPVVVVAHSDVCSWYREARALDAPAAWAAYVRVVEAGLRSADVVVAPTEYQGTRVRRHYGRAVDRVIPNGVDLPVAREDMGRAPSARKRILTVGRAWDEAKGVEILDRALEELGGDAPEVDLIGAVRHAARHARSLRRVRAHGHVDTPALHTLYRETRLYVGPSLYEPFGLAPAEAAAHGCALLLSGIGSFRELWRDSAMFFRPGDSADLARALARAMADPEMCDEMGRRASYRVRTRFTAERMAARYEKLYQALTKGRHHPSTIHPATSLELTGP